MKFIEEPFGLMRLPYPAERLGRPEEILFLDIETTGLSASSQFIYLIGCAFLGKEGWTLRQYFAEQKDEEREILERFLEFCAPYRRLVHFNGNAFDLPFLAQRAAGYDLAFDPSSFESLDLYRQIKPLRRFLKLTDCKEKTLQLFLGHEREDPYDGKRLIRVYHEYSKEPNLPGFQILLLHNEEDVEGLLQLSSLLAYADLFREPLRARKVQANYYKDAQGTGRRELIILLDLPAPLPVAISYGKDGIYLTAEKDKGALRIPLFRGELKYFYADYRNYYYVPSQDMAIHKSVANYVIKSKKEPASAATCYTKKESFYLPQWDLFVEPFFKRSYEDADLYFELTQEMKTNRDFFGRYASYVLRHLVFGRDALKDLALNKDATDRDTPRKRQTAADAKLGK